MELISLTAHLCYETKKLLISEEFSFQFGGPGGIRTLDTWIKSPLL